MNPATNQAQKYKQVSVASIELARAALLKSTTLSQFLHTHTQASQGLAMLRAQRV